MYNRHVLRPHFNTLHKDSMRLDMTGYLIRHAAFPLMERVKGNRIRACARELAASEGRSAAELRREQTNKLRALLTHAVRHVEFYRGHQDLQPLIMADPGAALRRLPILTKDLFRSQPDRFLADDADRAQLIPNRTGGSTGQPLTFYMDRKTVEYYEAARWRGLSWWGIRIGDPCAMIWGSPIELSQQQQRLQRWKGRLLKNQIVIPAFDLRRENMERYLRRIDAFRPRYIYGWASSLVLFARFMAEKGLSLRTPLRLVVNTAETLPREDRGLVSAAFRCPVIDEYGARDGGILAYECPQGGLHLTVENAWLEIVDLATREPVPAGEPGLLLVTDLNNYVMPRLRYQLGDLLSFAPEPCACGRGLPLAGDLAGRENDTFVTAAGAFVNGQFFTNLARSLATVKQFQVEQTARDKVALRLLRHGELAQEDVDAFRRGILERMGPVAVTVELAEHLPPGESGKFRTAIRRFPLP